jgi:hypothetical protein
MKTKQQQTVKQILLLRQHHLQRLLLPLMIFLLLLLLTPLLPLLLPTLPLPPLDVLLVILCLYLNDFSIFIIAGPIESN